MSYLTHAHIVYSSAIRGRVTACAAREGVTDPPRWVAATIWNLVGDDWVNRPGSGRKTPSPHAQVTVMNARFAELISGSPEPRPWARCGDQLYVDLDLSEENLPAGTRLAVGEAILEVQAEPHTGCAQFREWWGADALRLANGPATRHLRLRGANTRVVRSGVVRPGDTERVL